MRYLILFPLFAVLCIAQDADTGKPTIRVTTRLVQVNVIVKDKKDNPVTDLKQDDFVLKEAGKEQPIRLFLASSAQRLDDAPPNELPPNIFSNRTERNSGSSPNVTVILFDTLNTQFLDQANAKKQLLKFLQQVTSEERIAIYVLGRKLWVLHDFTDNAEHLAKTLAGLRVRVPLEMQPSDEPITPDTGLTDLDTVIEDANRVNGIASDFYTTQRVLLTTQAMEEIAAHVSALRGRKSLVWLSSAFPFALGIEAAPFDVSFLRSRAFGPLNQGAPVEQRNFSAEIQRSVRAMNQAGMAIYPVDARGLAGPDWIGSAFRRSSRRRDTAGFGNTFETMDMLADRTGGVAFRNTNNLKGAIRQAVEDGRMTYTLGYYPAEQNWDGKFHSVSVSVKRKGLDVRYAKGYFAVGGLRSTEAEEKAHLRDVLLSPLDATVIGLGARIDPSNQPKPGSMRLALQVDPSDITLVQTGDRWIGSLQYCLMQQSADASPLDTTTETLNLNLTKERYDVIVQRGLVLTKFLPLAPNAYRLRAVILDHPSGNIGSIAIPVSAVNPTAVNPAKAK